MVGYVEQWSLYEIPMVYCIGALQCRILIFPLEGVSMLIALTNKFPPHTRTHTHTHTHTHTESKLSHVHQSVFPEATVRPCQLQETEAVYFSRRACFHIRSIFWGSGHHRLAKEPFSTIQYSRLQWPCMEREKWYQAQVVPVLLFSATGGGLGYCACVHNHFTTSHSFCKVTAIRCTNNSCSAILMLCLANFRMEGHNNSEFLP
jgi:hypothetical protein